MSYAAGFWHVTSEAGDRWLSRASARPSFINKPRLSIATRRLVATTTETHSSSQPIVPINYTNTN